MLQVGELFGDAEVKLANELNEDNDSDANIALENVTALRPSQCTHHDAVQSIPYIITGLIPRCTERFAANCQQ